MKEKTKSLEISNQFQGEELFIQLCGNIDEDAQFDQIIELSPSIINFDFDDVRIVNSCGIREWILFMNKLGNTIKIRYEKCHQNIIDQVNLVKGFFPSHSEIISFYAPYFCESCEREEEVLLRPSEIRKVLDENSDKKQWSAPEKNCPSCAEEMEFDALEAQFFQFIDQFDAHK